MIELIGSYSRLAIIPISLSFTLGMIILFKKYKEPRYFTNYSKFISKVGMEEQEFILLKWYKHAVKFNKTQQNRKIKELILAASLLIFAWLIIFMIRAVQLFF